MNVCRVSVGDGQIGCADYGTGSAVLLIPGLGGEAQFWSAVAERLAGDFRVIAVDHRGCGMSSPLASECSIATMAGDALGVLDALSISSAMIVGHSTGGAVAQWIAAHHATRCAKLVLSSTWAGPNPYMAASFALRLQILEALGIEAYQDFVDLTLYPPQWYALHGEAIAARRGRKKVDVGTLRRRIAALLAFDGRSRLARILQPSLVICPRDDMVAPIDLSRELAAGIPGAKFFELPDGGHAAPRIDPDAYTRVVRAFLTGATAA